VTNLSGRPGKERGTRLLGAVFFLSGLASLIYQVAWQRPLTVHYGVGTVSITIIVSIYMLGLGLGSLLGGALAERVRRKLRVYRAVELALAAFGLASLPFLDFLGRATAGSSRLASGLCMAAFLCAPTLLMGMTLPLVTKAFAERVRGFLETVSFLYFVNTLGAAAGAALASYAIISFSGLDTAIYVAVAINLLLVALLGLPSAAETGAPEPAAGPTPPPASDLGRLSYLLVAVSGFLGIGYEIVWLRAMGILVKASPYAFSTVLAVYLLGIALGSQAARARIRRRPGTDQRNLFFLLQGAIGLYALLSFAAYYQLTIRTPAAALTRISFQFDLHPLPELPGTASAAEFLTGLFAMTDVLLWPLLFVFPATLLMGASFPLIASLSLFRPDREGMTVGTVYFFNVVGNVLGGVATGFLLLPALGTERTLLIFVAASLALGSCARRLRERPIALPLRLAAVAAALLGAVLALPGPGSLYRAMHTSPGEGYDAFVEEGLDGVVVTYVNQSNVWNYIDGLGHGHRPGTVYRTMTVEAFAWAPRVARTLVIGFGAGSVTELALASPGVERVTLVELNETLLRNLRKIPLFDPILSDPRLEIVVDDGRRELLRTKERFDLILMDPIRSTTAYSTNLYSRQFFELAARHLTPGGVLLVWLDEFFVIPRTLASALPHLRCYAGFCLASNQPMRENPERRQELLALHPPAERERILRMRGRALGGERVVLAATRGYPINQDWRPVSEYYLGLGLRRWLARR
jgi:predicted membrane-bound spermidine synthase